MRDACAYQCRISLAIKNLLYLLSNICLYSPSSSIAIPFRSSLPPCFTICKPKPSALHHQLGTINPQKKHAATHGLQNPSSLMTSPNLPHSSLDSLVQTLDLLVPFFFR